MRLCVIKTDVYDAASFIRLNSFLLHLLCYSVKYAKFAHPNGSEVFTPILSYF